MEGRIHREVLQISMESAVAFYERVESDVELQEKLTELGTKENVSQYVRDEYNGPRKSDKKSGGG